MNSAQHIIDTLKKELSEAKIEAGFENVGHVTEIKDGIARVSGLSQCFYNELLEFGGGVLGMALSLEEDSVGVIVLGDYSHIKEGDTVKTTGNIASVPVSDELLGRVIDPLGNPQDGREKIPAKKRYPIEKIAA